MINIAGPLRGLGDADAAAVSALCRIAYRSEAQLIGVPVLPPQRETAAQLADSQDQFWLGWSNGQLAGLASLECGADGCCLSRLAVHPDHRRRGYAARLLAAVMTECAGPLTVTTGSANEPALNLYLRLGFRPSGAFRTPDGIDMRRLVFMPA